MVDSFYGGGDSGLGARAEVNEYFESIGRPTLDRAGWAEYTAGKPYATMDPDHPDWGADVLYPKDSMVRHAGALWKSQQQTIDTEPGTNDAVWLYQIGGLSPEAIDQVMAGVEQLGDQKVAEAADQVTLAAEQAGAAAAEREAAAVSSGAAQAALVGAQAARDEASAVAATVGRFASAAAGLADTSVGETFWVYDGQYLSLYRHDAGPVATDLGNQLLLAPVVEAKLDDTARGVYGRIALRRAASSIPLYVDVSNALGGGARALYVPLSLYLDAPGFVSNFPVTITNGAASEITGYAKLVPASIEVYTAYYLPSTNSVALVPYTTNIEATEPGAIPLVTLYGSGQIASPSGLDVRDYAKDGLAARGVAVGAEPYLARVRTEFFETGPGLWPILDKTGLYGAANTVYLPLSIYYKRGAVVKTAAANAASAAVPGYCALAISGLQSSYVYFDLADDTFKVVSYSGGGQDLVDSAGDNAAPVLTTFGDGGMWCRWPLQHADDLASDAMWFRRPLAVDGGKLIVPHFAYLGAGASNFAVNDPATGFAEFDLPTGITVAHSYYLDRQAWIRGESTIVKRVVSGVDTKGFLGGFREHVFARAIGPVVSSPYMIVGDGVGGADRNMLAGSRNCSGVTRLFGTTAVVPVTDADLLALGLTHGLARTTGAGTVQVYGGADFGEVRGGQRAFFRCFVQTDTDNNFGTPYVYAWTSSASVQAVALQREKTISARAAIFSLSVNLVQRDDLVYFLLGADQPAGVTLVVCGLQYSTGGDGWWVSRSDFPAAPPLLYQLDGRIDTLEASVGDVSTFGALYPPHMFVAAGRPMPLYPKQIMRQRGEMAQSVAAFWTTRADQGYYPHVVEGRDMLLIDGAKCGTSGGIDIRRFGSDAGRLNARYRLPLTIHVAPASQSGAVRVLCIGDSLTNREQPVMLARKLQAMGMTPTTIGTMSNSSGGSWPGEGREGREWADFINEHTDAMIPVAVGGEAAYLALTENDRLGRNPFIRASTGGDDPAKVYNGYIFDLRFYLDRFGFADPDLVTINLGRNDISQQSQAETLAQLQRGFAVIYPQIRAALPNAHIGFVANLEPRSTDGDAAWVDDRWPTLLVEQSKLVQAARTAGDTKVWFVPAYAHMSSETGWPLTVSSTDVDTGLQSCAISDGIHFGGTGREQYAEAVAAWVAALRAGA